MNKKLWFSFFSQTGSEIYEISKKLGCFPDLIITNNDQSKIKINDNLLREAGHLIVTTPKKPSVDIYQFLLNKLNEGGFITLHGWLRIVPAEICNKYEIYNGHPGLINFFPELRGKDPQKRVFEGTYKIMGCVIHKVIPEVDSGEIISCDLIQRLEYMTLDNIISELHELSVKLWCDFLKEKIK